MKNNYSRSRRKTPWTDNAAATPMQSFLDSHAEQEFEHRHPSIRDTEESFILNTYIPVSCPHCAGSRIRAYGYQNTGLRRYRCNGCSRTFTILTGTLFENHKQPISEWIDTCLGLFSEQSFESISRNSRKAYNTTRYWVSKIFIALKGTQDDVRLSGNVYLDETYIKVIKKDIKTKEDGNEYRGLSRNQICIAIAYDGRTVFCCQIGRGKPSQRAVIEALENHIERGSTIIHDKEKAHRRLISELGLRSICYDSGDLKDLDDSENPLDPINRRCDEFKRLMRRHPGFSRDEIDGYLNLFAFIHNPPDDKYKKVEKLIERILKIPNSLKYRD